MKKYLIALPLVLIMILSMVPVMAADAELLAKVKFYKSPEKTDHFLPADQRIVVDESILTDAAKLKAEVEKQVRAAGFPKLDTDVQPEWVVEATVKAATEASTKHFVVEQAAKAYTFAELKAENPAITFTTKLDPVPGDTTNVTEQLAKKFNEKIQLIVTSGGTATAEELTIDVVEGDLIVVKDGEGAAPPSVVINKADKTEVAATPAEVSAIAYPKCKVDPSKPVEKWCPELCKDITVKVWNVWTNTEVEWLRHVYNVNPKKLPTFDGIYNHFKDTYLPRSGFQILKNWKGLDTASFPAGIEKNCEIIIYVLPASQYIDVYHELYNCCEDLDGNVKYELWKTFYESGLSVDFIKYHTELMIDHDLAKVFADTRLQKINATDFVFVDAYFDDGVRLDGYMTGKVYDMYGNLVETISNEWPSITLRYHRVGCDKEEEKVDNATVENTNTQAPVTASGTQLPATGAKDVTAFFLSAVALLGLGIFFAKKH